MHCAYRQQLSLISLIIFFSVFSFGCVGTDDPLSDEQEQEQEQEEGQEEQPNELIETPDEDMLPDDEAGIEDEISPGEALLASIPDIECLDIMAEKLNVFFTYFPALGAPELSVTLNHSFDDEQLLLIGNPVTMENMSASSSGNEATIDLGAFGSVTALDYPSLPSHVIAQVILFNGEPFFDFLLDGGDLSPLHDALVEEAEKAEATEEESIEEVPIEEVPIEEVPIDDDAELNPDENELETPIEEELETEAPIEDEIENPSPIDNDDEGIANTQFPDNLIVGRCIDLYDDTPEEELISEEEITPSQQ